MDADGAPFDDESPLLLQVDDLEADKPVFVDFQLRPQKEEHLWYALNVLDWPSGDENAQIQRKTGNDSTFADLPGGDASIEPNSDNGDMRLIPMLEIEIPFKEGHYGNLPVKEGAPLTRTDGITLGQWLDDSKLAPYGIGVRPMNDDGDLVAYVPLSLVQDETGGDRVAFTARMHYWPTIDGGEVTTKTETADWGLTQKVRMVWLVQMLNDHQDEDGEWVTDVTQVVRAYPEAWTLTGLAVREDHGLDVAITYEDPGQDDDLRYDDPLWALADGLQASFVVGRDQDDDGERDITIAEIDARFSLSSSATITERFGISTTIGLETETYAYDHRDFIAHIMMTETKQILSDTFTSYVDQGADAVTLLFSQETRARVANLDGQDDIVTIQENQLELKLDQDAVPLQTTALLNWAPFRLEEGEWQSYPIAEYVDKLEVRLKDVLDEYADHEDYEDILRGQLTVAKCVYLVLYNGTGGLVEWGDDLVGPIEPALTDGELADLLSGDDLTQGGGWMAAQGGRLTKVIYKTIKLISDLRESFLKYERQVDFLYATIGRWVKYKTHKGWRKLNRLGKAGFVLGVINAVIIVASAVLLFASVFLSESEALEYVMQGVGILWHLVSLTTTIVDAIKKGVAGCLRAIKTLEGVARELRWNAVFLVISVAVTWGVFIYQMWSNYARPGSLAFNAALAGMIASTISTIILLAISAIPVVGAIIATLIYLTDAITMLVCKVADPDPDDDEPPHWFCDYGISGLLTAGIQWIIYSANVMATIDDEDRLDLGEFEQAFLDPGAGLSVGNSLVISATVENKLDLISWEDTNYDWKAGAYWWQYSDRTLASSTFDYELDPGQPDIHGDLERFDIFNDWSTGDGRPFTLIARANTESPLEQAGINRTLPLYLAEGYAIPVQECWAAPIPLPIPFLIPVCHVRTETGTGHVNLGNSLYYDVFPPTLDEFYSLVEKDGGYALAWSSDSDPTFPRLRDADGDGLRNRVDDGADPDDHDWDTDNDGLSDFFEVQQGSDPQDADTDNDGLKDRDEIILGTDPLRTDTDFDGLTDREEVDGWEFVYGFDPDGSQLRTWVTANPLSLDPDLDQLTDFQERTFGFHPRVPSDPHVLTLDTRVHEEDAPLLLLHLDEAESASAFRDDSGYANNGVCEGDACPASGHVGKYGNASHFDGVNDDISVAGANTEGLQQLTVAAWVKLDALPGRIMRFVTLDSEKAVLRYNGVNGPGQLHFYVKIDGGLHSIRVNGALQSDTWQHVAGTYDGETMRLYLNGQEIGTRAVAGSIGGGEGVRLSDPGEPLEGFLDEVLLFDRALSGAAVEELMAGRYNTADFIVQPGDPLYYRAGVKNELFNRYAQGLLSVNLPVASGDVPPEDFILNPQEEKVISGTLAVAETAASGVYSLTQEVDAMITDWREASGYAELLYHFTEAAPEFADSSGSQPPRPGDCTACPASTTGRYGSALRFDGVDDYVYNDTVSGYVTGAKLTFGAWVSPTDSGGTGAILAFNTDGGGNRNTLLFDAASDRFVYRDDEAGTVFSEHTFGPGIWYHVMVVIDTDDHGTLYVNGEPEASFATSVRPDAEGTFSVGQEWDGGTTSEHFSGRIDEVVILIKALSHSAVQAYYSAPVFELLLDEPRGADQFDDASGFENHATCDAGDDRCPRAGEEGITSDSDAVLFSGNDYAAVDGSAILDLSGGDFALSAWVYPTGGPPNSDCPFWTDYYNYVEYEGKRGARKIFSRCEEWPIDYDWGAGGPGGGVQDEDFAIYWAGDFIFEEGDYTFRSAADGNFFAKLDGELVSDTDRPVHVTAGKHRVSVSYHHLGGDDAHVRFDWSPAPAFQPQGILGAEDDTPGDSYPTIQRVHNNEVRISFVTEGGDLVELTTDDDVLRSYRWNHVVATYDGDTELYSLYVDGQPVGDANASAGAPASNADFEVGRVSDEATLRLERIEVLEEQDAHECTMWHCDHAGEYLIEYREDGGWSEVWQKDCLSTRDEAEHFWDVGYEADIGVERTFHDEAEIRVYEDDDGECHYHSDGNDTPRPYPSSAFDGVSDLLGVYRFDTDDPAVEDHVHRFRDDRGSGWVDEVAVTWDYINTTPFRGKMDRVAIYRRAFDADEVKDLYDAGVTVLHMPLDDPPGSREFVDALGQAQGTCHTEGDSAADRCPTVGVPGRDNFALRFDGVDDVVQVNEANTDPLQELTVATWVKPLSLAAGDIMRFVTVGNEKAVLRYDGAQGPGQLHFYMSVDGALHSVRLDDALRADTWHHVAGSYDGEQMSLYLDGSLALTRTVTGTVGGGDAVRLSDATETLDGLLDEVVIYRRAFSANEIEDLYESPPEMLLTLDEPSGDTFEDETGRGHDGSCVSGDSCPDAGVKGQLGLAANFDGDDDVIEVPDSDGLDPENEMTLAAWVKLTDADVDQKIVGKTNGALDRGYVLGIRDGELFPEIWDVSGTRTFTACGTIDAGYWTHVAATWETGGDLVAYVNGQVACRVEATAKAVGSSSGPLRVGVAPWDGSSFPANGRIDHVTLYRRALSPREMQALFRLQAKWVEERQSKRLTVDADEPTSVLESDDVYRANQDVVLLVSAEDATSHVTMVELGVSADGGATYLWESAPACRDAAGNAAWCPTFKPTVGGGRYLIQTRATDGVGNVETPSQVYTFLVDDRPPDPNTAIQDGDLIRATRTPSQTWLVPLAGSAVDPDIAGTVDPGSGPAGISVRLTARAHPTDTLTPREATLDGGDWILDFPLPYPDATGWYTLAARATDAVGNIGPFTDLTQVGLDTSPPQTSLDPILGFMTGTITSTVTLTGRVTETGVVSAGVAGVRVALLPAAMASNSGTLARFHFDEPDGATAFANPAGDAATCDGSHCPGAGVDTPWGTGVGFDGEDDYLKADFVAQTLTDTHGFSFGGWMRAFPYYVNQHHYGVLAFNTSQGHDRNQIRYDSLNENYYYYDNDVSAVASWSGADGGWHHVMVSIDEAGHGALYKDGALQATFDTSVRPDPAGTFSIGKRWDDTPQREHFYGQLDEIVVYDRALTPEEVHALYDGAALNHSGDGVLSATWAYTVPEGLEGPYQINLRPVDVFDNSAVRADWPVWDGEIDTLAPRVELSADEHDFRTTYTCWARDVNLVWRSEDYPEYNFKCPCQTIAPQATVYEPTYLHEVSPWYADTFTDTTRLYELEASCTVLGPALGVADATMRAYDRHGNSATDGAPASQIGFAQVDSVVLTPTLDAIIAASDAISVSGRAYASSGLQRVIVEVDDVQIDEMLWSCSDVTDTHWATTWAAPSEGVHTLSSLAQDCNDDWQTLEHPFEVTVDALSPTLSITPTVLTTTHRLSQGRVALSGTVSDTNGISAVQVSVAGGGWQDASHLGGAWQLGWYVSGEPAGEQYTVTARATDLAGHTSRVTETVTVDLQRPNPITLTLSHEGEVITPGSTLTGAMPLDLDLSWVTSTQRTDLTYDVTWTVHTTEVNRIQDPQSPISCTGPFSSTYGAGEAQRIVPSVKSRLDEGNSQVDSWGSVYVDGPETPDYITLETAWGERHPYLGWMESGCTQMGIDRRTSRNAPASAAIDDQMALYVTWDAEALRLVWTGANWDHAGDLFIYLDTAVGGAAKALNPFGESGEISIDFSDLDLGEVEANGPGDLFDAESVIWVEDSDTAHLLTWSGTAWEGESTFLPPDQYRFYEGLRGGHTDLFLPFEDLGIDDPVDAPLALAAFAVEDQTAGPMEELRVWGTMPPGNPINSGRGVETLEFAAETYALPLTQVYVWPSVGPNVCPAEGFGDTDVHVGLSADPPGSTYGFHQNDLFWLWEEMSNFVSLDDLDVLDPPPIGGLEEPLQELETDVQWLLTSNAHEHFAFMDVDHPPVGPGDPITYTFEYVNRGTETATDVQVYATALFALSFASGVVETVSLGDIEPGETGRAMLRAHVDLSQYDECRALDPYAQCEQAGLPSEACQPFEDWDRYCEPFRHRAAMVGLVIDNVRGMANPLDFLWAQHDLDSQPPDFFGVQQPELFIGPGENTLSGYAYDPSGVSGLAFDPSGGPCEDPTPMSGVWSCPWDSTAANGGTPPGDGHRFDLRLRATDGFGHQSEWSLPRTFIVDALPPTVTFSAETTAAYSDTVVGDSRLVFRGGISDNRGIDDVVVCVEDESGEEMCGSAIVEATDEVWSSRVYTDAHSALITDTTICGGGEIEVDFHVTEVFTVGEVHLGLNVLHALRNDVVATLTSPGGRSVQVLGPEDGMPPHSQNYDVTLYDAATASLHDFKGDDDTAAPLFDRETRPLNPMRVFRGEGAAGRWTLTICDTQPITHGGSYNQAELTLVPQDTAARGGRWVYTLDKLEGLDGVDHAVTAYGTDLVGHQSQPISLSFTIDNLAPAVEVTKTVALTVTTANRPPVEVLAGTAHDGGRIVQMYALVKSPRGHLSSRQIGRGNPSDDWWFDLKPDETGHYEIWVNAVDEGENASQVGAYDVRIIAPPIADAGSDQGSCAGCLATLDGSGSQDPDGGPLTFGWTQVGGPPVTLDDVEAVSPTFAAPWITSLLTFTLTVTDTEGLTDTDTTVVDVTMQGDVAITKTVASPLPADPGRAITYTLVFTNYGPAPVTDVVITDSVPVSVTQTSVVSSGVAITETAPGYVWAVEELGAGEGGVITITGVLSRTLAGGRGFTNTATIAATGDTDSRNNTTSAGVYVADVDLGIDKAVSDETSSPGWTVVYTVSVTNDGPDGATGVVISDDLPSGVTYDSDNSGGAYDESLGIWTVGSLDAGCSATLHVTATVDAGAMGDLITNTAVISSADQGDSNPSNDEDEAVIVLRGADLAVDKTVSDGTPREGEAVTYAITLTNQGYTTTATVADALPVGVIYTSDDGGGAYDEGTGAWTVSELGLGSSATLHITATVDAGVAGSLITNTAAVSSTSRGDVSWRDNVDSAVIAAQHPDAVIITVTPGAGGRLVYTSTEGLTTTVVVPPGAVSERLRLIFTPLDGPTHPTAPLLFGGHAFLLEVYKGPYVQPGYVFGEPLFITMHYSDEDVARIIEAGLTLDVWNESGWEDAACGAYDRHPEANWLSVDICHLSEYALLGEGEAIPVGGSTLALATSASLWQRTLLILWAVVIGLAVAVAVTRGWKESGEM